MKRAMILAWVEAAVDSMLIHHEVKEVSKSGNVNEQKVLFVRDIYVCMDAVVSTSSPQGQCRAQGQSILSLGPGSPHNW